MIPSGQPAVRQSAACVLMVRPACFAFNEQTAASNRFQHSAESAADAQRLAQAEFASLERALLAADVQVCVAEDTPSPAKPDAVFPNNWVSWHADGTVVLYPLLAENRRPERRPELLAQVAARTPFVQRRLIDLSSHEQSGRFLEGTGSLVLDRLERVAFACRSPRTDEQLVRAWATLLDYEPLVFDARLDGVAPYHTNVLLAIGSSWAVVCPGVIAPHDRQRVLQRLAAGGREVLTVTVAALRDFGANILELCAGAAADGGRRVLALSVRARAALETEGVWQRLARSVDATVAVAVPTIERFGGGSVRCMLAEVPGVQS